MKTLRQKIDKLQMGQPYQHWGMDIELYSIGEAITNNEANHSTIRENVLINMIEKMQSKINELIEAVNKLNQNENN